MAKTKGSNSYVWVMAEELCKYLPRTPVKVSRCQLQSLGLLGGGKITALDNTQVESIKLEKKPEGGITVKVTNFDKEEIVAEVKADEKVVAAEEI